MTLALPQLKHIKNTVIGNPQAKSQVASDESFVVTLVQTLTQPPPAENNPDRKAHEAVKIEAAQIVASLAHGPDAGIAALLRARIFHYLIYALSTFTGANSSPALRHAYARGLQACAAAAADVLGPALAVSPLYSTSSSSTSVAPSATSSTTTTGSGAIAPGVLMGGLRPDRNLDPACGFGVPEDADPKERERRRMREARMVVDAREALDYLFKTETLDVYLPVLAYAHVQSSSTSSSPMAVPQMHKSRSSSSFTGAGTSGSGAGFTSTSASASASGSASTSTSAPLPLPYPPSSQQTTHIAHLLSSALRAPAHRKNVTEWVPWVVRTARARERARALEREREGSVGPSTTADGATHRARAASLGRRGWETASLGLGIGGGIGGIGGVGSAGAGGAGRGFGWEMWVVKGLVGVLGYGPGGKEIVGGGSKDPKVIEAVLSALAALARDNPPVAVFLGRMGGDREYTPVLPHLLAFTKSRAVDVQLAACLCVTNILRALTTAAAHPYTLIPPREPSPPPLPSPLPAVPAAEPAPAPAQARYSDLDAYDWAVRASGKERDPLDYSDRGRARGEGSSRGADATASATASGSGNVSRAGRSQPAASGSGSGSASGSASIPGPSAQVAAAPIPIHPPSYHIPPTHAHAHSHQLGFAGHTPTEPVSAFSLVHNLPGGGGPPGPSQAAMEETCLRTVMNVVNRMLGLEFAGFWTGPGGYSMAASTTAAGNAGGGDGGASAGRGGGGGGAAGGVGGPVGIGMGIGIGMGMAAALAGGATTAGMAAARSAGASAGIGGAAGEAEQKDAEREREERYRAAMAGAVARTRACYILHYLIIDEPQLCRLAYERGCLDYVGALIHAVNPPEPPPLDWEEGEPESIRELREAALTALASLALHSDDVRRSITDNLRLLPCISRALRAGSSPSTSPQLRVKHIGTRHAACQVVRAMSRSVSVLRTSLLDSGLGMDVLRIVLGQGMELGDRWGGSVSAGSSRSGIGAAVRSGTPPRATDLGKGREKDAEGSGDGGYKGGRLWLGDDRRVIAAALSAVCNIVNDFSPLRPIYLEEKIMPRLVAIIRDSEDAPLRLNALWAIKNLVRKTSTETKRDIMSQLGWPELNNFMADGDAELQEQAFNLLRNLAENEEGIAMVFRELTPATLLDKIVTGLNSPSEDVVLQTAFALGNLANGTQEHQDAIMQYPGILSALNVCLEEAPPSIRRPAVGCIYALAKGNPRRRRDMMSHGIISTLKQICEWSGHGHGPSHSHSHVSHASYSGSGAGNFGMGMSVSPTTSTAGGWGGRSPTVRSSSMSFPAPFGSWSGTGAHFPGGPIFPAGRSRPWSTPTLGLLEDDKDVVDRARQALDWLEHGETYVMR